MKISTKSPRYNDSRIPRQCALKVSGNILQQVEKLKVFTNGIYE